MTCNSPYRHGAGYARRGPPKGPAMNPVLLIFCVIVALYFLGGGYYGHANGWNGNYGYQWGGGGIGLLVIILLVLWLTGVI